MKYLEPNHGFAILKPIETKEQTVGRIVIPDMGNDVPLLGELVKISPIYNFNRGEFAPCLFNVGDIVMFPNTGAKKAKIDGEDYYIAGIHELLAAIKEE